MTTYRSKPTTVEAIRYTNSNAAEVCAWLDSFGVRGYVGPIGLIVDSITNPRLAKPGDYIIKTGTGNAAPCKSDLFEASYDTSN